MVNLYLIHMLLEHVEYQKLLSKVDFLFVPLANPGKFKRIFNLRNSFDHHFKMVSFILIKLIGSGTKIVEASAQTALELTLTEISIFNLLLELT